VFPNYCRNHDRNNYKFVGNVTYEPGSFFLSVATQIQQMLDDDRFRDESTDCDLSDAITDLAHDVGWKAVYAEMLDVLRDESQSQRWYDVIACLFGTDCHDRDLPCEPDYLIALLYDCLRLHPDLGVLGSAPEATGNLVWSITHNLKRVGYLSKYDPEKDPSVCRQIIGRKLQP
jgi:hypothetical protein